MKVKAFFYLQSCHLGASRSTWGGNAGGADCTIPFKYKGMNFATCTYLDANNRGTFWCATTSDYDKDKRWGIGAPIGGKLAPSYNICVH